MAAGAQTSRPEGRVECLLPQPLGAADAPPCVPSVLPLSGSPRVSGAPCISLFWRRNKMQAYPTKNGGGGMDARTQSTS